MENKEIRLAKFIQDNFVEIKVYDNYNREISGFGSIPECELSGYTGGWKIYAFVYTYDLDELSQILGDKYFEDGIQVIWKKGYVVIDLMDIAEYFYLDIKKLI